MRVVARLQLPDHRLHLALGQRLACFDGGRFAHPANDARLDLGGQRRLFLLQVFDHRLQRPGRVAASQNGRHGAHHEAVRAKHLNLEAQPGQQGQAVL